MKLQTRIQRKRTRGWKIPENTKYVGRPTKWGNPFKLSVDGWILYHKSDKLIGSAWCIWSQTGGFGITDILELYELWLDGKLQRKHPYLPTPPSIEELRGKDLSCFCSLSSPCHVDIILKKLKMKLQQIKDNETIKKQIVYEFLYYPSSYESEIISIHKTKKGAEMALEFHKNERLKEWEQECKEYPKCKERPFDLYQWWTVRERELLP